MSDNAEPKDDKAASPTAVADGPMRMSMGKRGNVTVYTLECNAGEHQRHMSAFGTKDSDFFHGLLQQIVNAGAKGQCPDENGIKFMLGLIRAQKPRDEIEATLLSEISACQLASMRAGQSACARRNASGAGPRRTDLQQVGEDTGGLD
jgi:hypothetical protein